MKKYLAIYGKPRYLGIVAYNGELENGEWVLTESVRGEDIAIIAGAFSSEEQEERYRDMKVIVERSDNAPKATEPAVTDLKYIRKANDYDIEELKQYANEEKIILHKASEILIPHELDIKLIDAEFLKGKQKLFIYFSADQRVDFRAYVRDLAHEFKTRIELRQIGVRDEAKIVGGIAPCGNPCCCSYWLHQFEPVGIKMVKEQNLALNPTKISGICGRLMCCMSYEHNIYKELWEKVPSQGTKIKNSTGNVVVNGINIGKKEVRCFVPEHGEIYVPISKFDEFRQAEENEEDWSVIEDIIKVPESDEPKHDCSKCQKHIIETEILLKKDLNIFNAENDDKEDSIMDKMEETNTEKQTNKTNKKKQFRRQWNKKKQKN